MFIEDTSDIPGNGGYNFGFAYAPFAQTNGPGGETNYTDDVWAWGVNAGSPGARLDNTKPSLAQRLESKYYDGTRFGSEYHLAHIDTSGVERRPISSFVPSDGGTGSGVSFTADTFYYYSWSGTLKAQISAVNGTFDLLSSTKLRAAVNNASFLQQQNASGTFIDLLKVDAGNQAKFSTQGAYIVGARAGSTATFPGEFLAIQPTSANSGDIGISLHAPAVTGSYIPMNFRADASTGSMIQCLNYSANTTANIKLFMEALSTGGDPVAVFSVNGGSSWSVGADNSDSDKFKISSGGTLGTNDRVTIDANTVAFGLPAKLPSFTVAGVPSASTAGAGAMIYVSDESGGAVPAFSDGTNWRRVTDRAVIS